VRTVALWMTALPSPPVWTTLHAEKVPDSNPSAKTLAALAGAAATRSRSPVATAILMLGALRAFFDTTS
jgi:hypothetical protein